ncbi:uncharacterized protein BJX67DRAFT_352561, partial [Aspergillus lucknowensis]
MAGHPYPARAMMAVFYLCLAYIAFCGYSPALVQCFIEDTFLAEFGTAAAWRHARTLHSRPVL